MGSHFLYSQGINFVQLILVITILEKRNYTSLIYIVFQLRIQTIGYYPHLVDFDRSPQFLQKQKQMTNWLTYLVVFTQIIIY